jgi:hypothetical protein
MKRLTILNRTELFRIVLLGLGILLGIIGIATASNFVTITGLLCAIVSIVFPTNILNPYKATFFDKIAGWFKLYTTGLFWTRLKEGDILSFSTVAYTYKENEHIAKTMTVEVIEKASHYIILKYSGDNIMLLNAQQADFTREMPRAEFLKKLNHMQSVEEAKWNETIIKVKL